MPRRQDHMFVESVAYQEALPQMLEYEGVKAEAIKPKGDKRTRISLTSTMIKSGLIKFPKKGCEDLINQLVRFGVEKHDDLADAFSLVINAITEKHADDQAEMVGISFVGQRYRSEYHGDYVDVEV